jgi:hypothetical protein
VRALPPVGTAVTTVAERQVMFAVIRHISSVGDGVFWYRAVG